MLKLTIWEKDGSIAQTLWQTGKADFPIYDMHAHMGKHFAQFHARCEAPEMIRHAQRIGVKRICFSHYSVLRGPASNSVAADVCRKYPDILRMYVGINPNYPERMRRDLADYDKYLPFAVGLKFLADYHKVKVTDPAYAYALDFASERGLPILNHTWGGSPFNGGAVMLEAVQRYPKVKFILGHSIFREWDYAERCVKESAGNVWLELTSIPGERGIIEDLVRRVGSERILYGTDLPWFDEYQAVGGVVSADISEDDIRNILYRNADRLLGKDW